MKKWLLILIAFGSVILNCFFIFNWLPSYIQVRKLVQETVKQELEPSEFSKYKLKDIKKEVKWYFFYEDPDALYLGAHFTIVVENGSATFIGGY